MWSEEENMLRESVARFANETIKPRVRVMDETSTLEPEVLQGCFEQGECWLIKGRHYLICRACLLTRSLNGRLTNHRRTDGH